MSNSFSRRDALWWAGAAAMASTFLPITGRHRVWSHPAEKKLATRPLGKTGREVTTFGLAGGNKVMWKLPGDEAVEIILKAVHAGINYLETANIYHYSQVHYGEAFRVLNLIPGEPGYDANLRSRLMIASKSMLRQSVIRDGSPRMGSSEGKGNTCIDDLKRTMTQMFGDGRGMVPDGAYLDLMQIHSLTDTKDVDAVFEGLEDPSNKDLPKIGTLAGLIDYRDGTNYTGTNPEHRKWIRHIGITGHENPAVHMYAMRKDKRNDLETLLVAINPNDRHYFCHQTNSIPVAHAKGMGVIAMKIFADGVLYGLEKRYAHTPGQSVSTVGKRGLVSYEDFLHYSLSAPGVATAIAGIGLTDPNNDPDKDQLVADLAACQAAKELAATERRKIEERVEELHGTDTNFFQRPTDGLQPPQNVRLAREGEGPLKVMWDTAYAAGEPLSSYEVYRRHERIATIPFTPQTSEEPVVFVDEEAPNGHEGGLWYRVRAVDAAGRSVDSLSLRA